VKNPSANLIVRMESRSGLLCGASSLERIGEERARRGVRKMVVVNLTKQIGNERDDIGKMDTRYARKEVLRRREKRNDQIELGDE
jgi:hypothetical protein